MPFHYKVESRSGGGLTTGTSIQESISGEGYIKMLALRCLQSEPVVTSVLSNACELLIDLAKDTKKVESIGGYFYMRPTSGGHEDTDCFTGTVESINAGLSLILNKEGNLRFAHNFTSVRDGAKGLRTAVVTRVLNKYNDSPDTYTIQKGLQLDGSEFPQDLTDVRVGVFFQCVATGVEVRVANGDYVVTEPSRMVVLPPAGLVGDQRLVVKAAFGQNIRAYTYVTILTAAAV